MDTESQYGKRLMKSRKSKIRYYTPPPPVEYVAPYTYEELRQRGFNDEQAYAMLSKHKVQWLMERDVRVTTKIPKGID